MKIIVGTAEILLEENNRDLVDEFLAIAPKVNSPKLLLFPFLARDDPGLAEFKDWLFAQKLVLARNLALANQPNIESLIYAWAGMMVAVSIVSQQLDSDACDYIMHKARKTICPNRKDSRLLTSPITFVADPILPLDIFLDEMTKEYFVESLFECIDLEKRIPQLTERFKVDFNYRAQVVCSFYLAARFHFWTQKIIFDGTLILSKITTQTGNDLYAEDNESMSYLRQQKDPLQEKLVLIFSDSDGTEAKDALEQLQRQWAGCLRNMLTNYGQGRLSPHLDLATNDGAEANWQSGLNLLFATLAKKWTNMRMDERLEWLSRAGENVHQRVQDLVRNETSDARGRWHVFAEEMVDLDQSTDDRDGGQKSTAYNQFPSPYRSENEGINHTNEGVLLLLEQNRTRFESIVGKTPTKVIFTLWEHEGQISNEELATEIGKSDSTVEKSKRKIRQAEDQISLLVGDIF